MVTCNPASTQRPSGLDTWSLKHSGSFSKLYHLTDLNHEPLKPLVENCSYVYSQLHAFNKIIK